MLYKWDVPATGMWGEAVSESRLQKQRWFNARIIAVCETQSKMQGNLADWDSVHNFLLGNNIFEIAYY